MIKKKTALAQNTATSLQIILAAEVYLAKGQFLLERHTSNIDKSLIYRAGARKSTVRKEDRI
jgi:hypothetical protein